MSTAYEAEVMDDIKESSDNGTMLANLARAEIDVQITTAKQYPRSLKAFKQQAMEMATLDEDTAASMFYVLPRAGKKIEGPSIRMAEVVGSCFGNLRYGARIVDVGDEFLTAQGACHDLEKNIAITYDVRRRITNKQGVKFNADMVQTTGNAAMSIALREAIFRVVPRALYKNIVDEAKLVSVGNAATMSEKRHKAFDWFAKAGAPQAKVLEFLGRAGIDDVTIDDLITLRGMVTSIKDGELTVDEIFAKHETPAAKARKSDLNDKLQPKAAVPEAGPKMDASPAKPPATAMVIDAMKSAITKAKTVAAVQKVFEDAKVYAMDDGQLMDLDAFAGARIDKLNEGKQQQQEIV